MQAIKDIETRYEWQYYSQKSLGIEQKNYYNMPCKDFLTELFCNTSFISINLHCLDHYDTSSIRAHLLGFYLVAIQLLFL